MNFYRIILIIFFKVIAFAAIAQYTGGCGGGGAMNQKLKTCLDGCCLPTVPVISSSSTSNCGTISTSLIINSGLLNDAAYWQWYSGSCSSNPIGRGTTIIVTPSVTTTYYARAEGGCITSGSCASITIKVLKPTTSNTTITRCKSFLWNGTTYTTTGNYTWHGINAAGCDSTANLHLTILTVSISSVTNSTNAFCNNTATGSITVTPTNGISPFTYRLGTTGSYVTSNTFANIKAGKYTVSILDAIGCSGITNQVIIGERDAVKGLFTKKDVDCYGNSTGSYSVNGYNGIPPYWYRKGITGAFTKENSFTNLSAGTHNIYIQDALGCIGNATVNILQPLLPLRFSYNLTDVKCFGEANGFIGIIANGGTSPYQFKLNKSGYFGKVSYFSNLIAASYSISIRDTLGCTYDQNVIIKQPPLLNATFTKTDESCPGSFNGTIMVLPVGGTPPYTYRIGNSGTFGSSNIFGGLPNGSYSITFNDANNCSGNISVTVAVASFNCFSKNLKIQNDSASLYNKPPLTIKVLPNPCRSIFKMQIRSTYPNRIQVRVMDANGRPLYITNCSPDQTISFGESFLPGIYLAEVKQDLNYSFFKIIKY